MIPQNKLDQMDPDLIPLALAFDAEMEKEGITYSINEVLRTKSIQVAYFAQGRENLSTVNKLRATAGLGPISNAENQYCITWTMKSRHLPNVRGKSDAFDIVILKPGGARTYDTKFDRDSDSVPDYIEAAKIGEKAGLQAGANFKRPDGSPRPDYPHFQLKRSF